MATGEREKLIEHHKQSLNMSIRTSLSRTPRHWGPLRPQQRWRRPGPWKLSCRWVPALGRWRSCEVHPARSSWWTREPRWSRVFGKHQGSICRRSRVCGSRWRGKWPRCPWVPVDLSTGGTASRSSWWSSVSSWWPGMCCRSPRSPAGSVGTKEVKGSLW